MSSQEKSARRYCTDWTWKVAMKATMELPLADYKISKKLMIAQTAILISIATA